ncbi:hypothetical protein ABII15_05670 [Streptomyces sp. HUAS MG91]|uniref:Uncharacterized protein n=1 Tax=Streptomyces tabacisoli TaxID=3156398 RepID=A0AAU8IMQ7_9ACTN
MAPTHRPARTITAVPTRAACPAATRSPVQALEAAFLALAAEPVPLTLPAHLLGETEAAPVLPVDQFRSRLAHPSTAPFCRAQAWQEVAGRAQERGAPWDLVAVALTVPVLHRMLARLARPAQLERAELEQEALAAVAGALRTVDVERADVGRELFSAADRAVNRLAYAARRRDRHETSATALHLGRRAHPAAGQLTSPAETSGASWPARSQRG